MNIETQKRGKAKYVATRAEVYAAIDTERDYQDSRWNEDTTLSGGIHSLEEWIMYIERYIGVAKECLSTKPMQQCYPETVNTLRKIAGMAVCALEQHGAPKRN